MSDPRVEDDDRVALSGWIAWFARNKVAANILMGVLIVTGLMALFSVKREVFPFSDSYRINVSVAYPGAAPEEVEEGICKRIENEIFGLEGVKKITASATEGAGTVTVEVMRDFDVDEVLDEVKTRIDAIDNFPALARRPIVREVVASRAAVSIAVSSAEGDEKSLKALAERIRDGLTDLAEITQAQLISARPYEISIEVSETALRRYGLTMDAIARRVREASLDLPGGSVKTAGGEVMLRSIGQRYTGDEFASIVLLTDPDGTLVRLGDVGRVVDGFEDNEQASLFDGERTVLVQVYRVGDQDVVKVVQATRDYVEKIRGELPPGVKLTLWNDETVLLRGRIDLLSRNMLSGLVLVFLVLAVFLRLKLAFWVALGIPVSFLGCVALMPTLDISINMISLFAFLMVLGIVVDDAIVVGESVHSHRRRIADGTLAAIKGTKLVSVPVTFGVLTTIAAFTPMLNMTDGAAKLWRDIGMIVIGCLLFSLVESKLILPAHLSSMKFEMESEGTVTRVWDRFRGFFTGNLERFIERWYRPALEVVLRWRYVAICAAVSMFAAVVGMAAMGYIKTAYFPPMEGDNVVANLVMPQGTPIDETTRKVHLIDRAAHEIKDELRGPDGQSPIQHVMTSIGTQPFMVLKSQNRGNQSSSAFVGSHLGEVNLQLLPAESRSVSAAEVLRRLKAKIGDIPDVEELTFSTDLFGTGKDISVQVAGEDIAELRAAADAIKLHLGEVPGVSEIADSYRGGKREVKLHIKPSAQTLGLSLGDLASQVRQGFYGEEIQRIQKKGEDMRVMLRYPDEQRRTLAALEDMRIRTPQGDEVPFHTVADARFGRGFATISRADRSRTVEVTARVNPVDASANDIVKNLDEAFLPDLMARHPTLRRYSFEGDNREEAETQASLRKGYLLVLFLIYALLAVPFRSYLQPFLVMSAVPFGFVGAILGHWVMGLELSIMSMFGFVALTGVVVNDNLVLIDFVNQKRREGVALRDAVLQAGTQRFRPILLTSLTTCASLTPLLAERSVQAMFLIPTAVSLAFGVMFATVISLLLVPCLYLVLEDLRGLLGSGRGSGRL